MERHQQNNHMLNNRLSLIILLVLLLYASVAVDAYLETLARKCGPGFMAARDNDHQCIELVDPTGVVYISVEGGIFAWNLSVPLKRAIGLKASEQYLDIKTNIIAMARLEDMIFYVTKDRSNQGIGLHHLYVCDELVHNSATHTLIDGHQWRSCSNIFPLDVPQFDHFRYQRVNSISVDWLHWTLYLSSSEQIVVCAINVTRARGVTVLRRVRLTSCTTIVTVQASDLGRIRIQGLVVRPRQWALIYSMMRIEHDDDDDDVRVLESSLVQTNLVGRHQRLVHRQMALVANETLERRPEQNLARFGFTNLQLVNKQQDRLCWLNQNRVNCLNLVELKDTKHYSTMLVNLTKEGSTTTLIGTYLLTHDRILWIEKYDGKAENLIYWTMLDNRLKKTSTIPITKHDPDENDGNDNESLVQSSGGGGKTNATSNRFGIGEWSSGQYHTGHGLRLLKHLTQSATSPWWTEVHHTMGAWMSFEADWVHSPEPPCHTVDKGAARDSPCVPPLAKVLSESGVEPELVFGSNERQQRHGNDSSSAPVPLSHHQAEFVFIVSLALVLVALLLVVVDICRKKIIVRQGGKSNSYPSSARPLDRLLLGRWRNRFQGDVAALVGGGGSNDNNQSIIGQDHRLTEHAAQVLPMMPLAQDNLYIQL